MSNGWGKGRPAGDPKSGLKFHVRLDAEMAKEFHKLCRKDRRTRQRQLIHAVTVFLAVRGTPELVEMLAEQGITA